MESQITRELVFLGGLCCCEVHHADVSCICIKEDTPQLQSQEVAVVTHSTTLSLTHTHMQPTSMESLWTHKICSQQKLSARQSCIDVFYDSYWLKWLYNMKTRGTFAIRVE